MHARTSLSFIGLLVLAVVCCSCQKRPRRIVVSDSFSADLPAKKVKKTVHTLCQEKGSGAGTEGFISRARSCEAKLPDIPFPVGAKPLPQYFVQQKNQVSGAVLGYYVPAGRLELLAFYEQQMTGLGWCFVRQVEGKEAMQLFKKPDRYCIVSIRDYKGHAHKYQQIVITVFCVGQDVTEE